MGQIPPALVAEAVRVGRSIGVDPADLITAIGYETGGTYDPWQRGPTTQWGTHRGLIQMGEPQRRQYGVTEDTSLAQQMDAVGRYLVDAGVRPGHGLLDIYSAINAGGVGKYGASDGPGDTVRSHVQTMEETFRPGARAAVSAQTLEEYPSSSAGLGLRTLEEYPSRTAGGGAYQTMAGGRDGMFALGASPSGTLAARPVASGEPLAIAAAKPPAPPRQLLPVLSGRQRAVEDKRRRMARLLGGM